MDGQMERQTLLYFDYRMNKENSVHKSFDGQANIDKYIVKIIDYQIEI